jgi:NHS family xanthosine MFS transporter
MWVISLSGLEKSSVQFYVASAASLCLGLYSLTLPKCPPLGRGNKKSLFNSMGLEAFALFKSTKMALFFLFAMFLGAALQLTNAYGDTFLHDFAKVDAYKDLIAVKYPAIIMSISQMSETLFILTIPFFLRKFGIKKVMLMSMIAWMLRYGLFAFSNPAGGLWMIILSCIMYGMAFDFFNISGSIFVETQVAPNIRASAQGLFMMMTGGLGTFFGGRISGFAIDRFFLTDGNYEWRQIWITFAIYAAVVAVLFSVFFKHKHDPKAVGQAI